MDDKSTPKRLLVTGVGIRRGMGHWFGANGYLIGHGEADVTVTELPDDEPTPDAYACAEQDVNRIGDASVALAKILNEYEPDEDGDGNAWGPLAVGEALEELANQGFWLHRATAPEPTPGLVEAARTMLRLWETSETLATWREGFEALRAALEALPDDAPDEWKETDSTGYWEATRAGKPRRRATTYDGGTAEERYWVKRQPIPAEPPGSVVIESAEQILNAMNDVLAKSLVLSHDDLAAGIFARLTASTSSEAGWPNCATCDGGGCFDCTDPS